MLFAYAGNYRRILPGQHPASRRAAETFHYEQEVVDGTVVAITPREIVVNIGYKSDGIIPANELRHNPNLKTGDVIEVYIEKQEDATGQLVLSHKKALLLQAWNRVNKAYEDGEVINGYIKSKTKGGLIVEIFGIEAFLPGSQIDVKPIRDFDVYVDKKMELKVVLDRTIKPHRYWLLTRPTRSILENSTRVTNTIPAIVLFVADFNSL